MPLIYSKNLPFTQGLMIGVSGWDFKKPVKNPQGINPLAQVDGFTNTYQEESPAEVLRVFGSQPPGVLVCKMGKWIVIYVLSEAMLKFTPPHKCHTTTVLYVYFGSRVKQLSVLFAVHIF